MWKKSISQSRVSFALAVYTGVFSSTTVQPQRCIGLASRVGKKPHTEVVLLQNVKRPQLASTWQWYFPSEVPTGSNFTQRPNTDTSKLGERGARSDWCPASWDVRERLRSGGDGNVNHLLNKGTNFCCCFCWVFSGIILISPARLLLLVCALPTAAVIAASPCLLRRFMVCIFLCMVLLRCLKNVPANQALMDHSLEKINSCLLPWSLCYGTVWIQICLERLS